MSPKGKYACGIFIRANARAKAREDKSEGRSPVNRSQKPRKIGALFLLCCISCCIFIKNFPSNRHLYHLRFLIHFFEPAIKKPRFLGASFILWNLKTLLPYLLSLPYSFPARNRIWAENPDFQRQV